MRVKDSVRKIVITIVTSVGVVHQTMGANSAKKNVEFSLDSLHGDAPQGADIRQKGCRHSTEGVSSRQFRIHASSCSGATSSNKRLIPFQKNATAVINHPCAFWNHDWRTIREIIVQPDKTRRSRFHSFLKPREVGNSFHFSWKHSHLNLVSQERCYEKLQLGFNCFKFQVQVRTSQPLSENPIRVPLISPIWSPGGSSQAIHDACTVWQHDRKVSTSSFLFRWSWTTVPGTCTSYCIKTGDWMISDVLHTLYRVLQSEDILADQYGAIRNLLSPEYWGTELYDVVRQYGLIGSA